MKRLFFTSIFMSISLIFFAQIEIHKSIYFDSNQSDIKPEFYPLLDEIAANKNVVAALLQGHTDNVGNLDFNKELSKKRVESVLAYLVHKGMASDLFLKDFFGEMRPKTSNQSQADKAENRRVDLFITVQIPLIPEPVYGQGNISEKEVVKVQAEPQIVHYDNSDLNDYLKQFANTQSFLVYTKQDTVLKIEEGNLFYFKKNSLQTTCDSVLVKITPFQNNTQMLYGNVTTTSNGGVLESFGMFEVRAFCNEKEVSLKKGQKLDTFSPVDASILPNYKVRGYEGIRDSITQEVTWKEVLYSRVDVIRGRYLCGFKEGKYKKPCIVKRWFASSKTRRKWESRKRTQKERARLKKKFKGVNFTKMTDLAAKDVNYYVFSSNRMGLMNCDILLDLPEKKRVLVEVKLDPEFKDNTQIRLAIKGQRIVIPATKIRDDHVAVFDKVPKNKNCYLVAVQKTDQLKIGLQNIKPKQDTQVEMALEQVKSFKELDKKLKAIR